MSDLKIFLDASAGHWKCCGRPHLAQRLLFAHPWLTVRQKVRDRLKWKGESWFHYRKVLFVGVVGIAETWFYLA